MSLSAVIKDISENWLDYRNHCLDKSKTGAVIRKVKEDHKIYDHCKNLQINEVAHQH